MSWRRLRRGWKRCLGRGPSPSPRTEGANFVLGFAGLVDQPKASPEPMPRFPHLRLILVLLLFLGGEWVCPALGKGPNFVVVMVEGAGFSDWGCFGGEGATPYLDWMAENGVRFSEAYRGANPRETEDSLLSGYFAGQVRAAGRGGRLASWGRVFPRVLQGAGYRTYYSGVGLGVGEGMHVAYVQGELDGERWREGSCVSRQRLEAGSDRVAEEAVSLLVQHQGESSKQPFFEVVHFAKREEGGAVFDRGEGAEGGGDPERFKGGAEELWKNRWERFHERTGEGVGVFSAQFSGESGRGVEGVGREMKRRALWAQGVDGAVGKLVEQVKLMGGLENTVWVFVGGGAGVGGEDGGAPVAACPLRWSEHGVHESAFGTPMIWSEPGLGKARGSWRSQAVHVADVAPTLLRMAGVSWPKAIESKSVPALDGLDLSPVLRENRTLPGRAFWWLSGENRVFRLGDWKWISVKGQMPELYYLKADRSESVNLAEANFERILEMETQWKRMQERFEKAVLAEGEGAAR